MNTAHDPYLAVGAVLFVLGAVGFVTKRNLILIMLSAELMLHGVSLTMLAFGQMHGAMDGQVFTVMVLTVATCEAGIALALVLSLYQRAKSLDLDLWSALKEEGLPVRIPASDDQFPEVEPEPMVFPALTPAGVLPDLTADAPLAGQRGPRVSPKLRRTFEYGDPDVVDTKPQA